MRSVLQLALTLVSKRLVPVALALLVTSGCVLLPPPHGDYRPIHEAAAACDVTTVAQILATNAAAVNFREDGGRAPLHVAAGRCCTNVMAVLLQSGAKIELKGNSGETPLHVAAQEGCVPGVGAAFGKWR